MARSQVHQKTVSVIIPAYGRILSLRRAVCSALDQTLAPAELIVVDDGSPQPIAREVFPDDTRIKLLRIDINSGPAAARNAGIAAAEGEWIAFLDSDDFWYPHKLDTQWKVVQTADDQERTVFVTGWTKIWKGRTSCLVIPRGAENLRDFALGCWFSPGSTAFVRREAFDRVGLFDAGLRRLEDYDWYLRFGRLGGRLVVIDQALAGVEWHALKQTRDLDSAIRRLKEQYLSRASLDYLADRKVRGRLRAYLKLVQASVLWRTNRKISAVTFLMESLVANPRLTLQNSLLHYTAPVEEALKSPAAGLDG
jgi:glycosyltransferase involved in cell wall biosynthesis